MSHDIELVEQWILKYHPEIKHIDYEFDLIDSRLIDSLRFMELIFFLEQISAKKIDTNNINMNHFRTLQNIVDNFLTPTH